MDLINEVNKIRDFMGLNPLNENQLINEGVPSAFKKIVDDVYNSLKGTLKKEIEATIKPSLDKFLSAGNVDNFVNKNKKNAEILQDWLKTKDGKTFKTALKNKVDAEPDMAKQLSYNSYLKAFDDLERELFLDLNIPKPKTQTQKPKTRTQKPKTQTPKGIDDLKLDIPEISNSAKTTAKTLGINADDMFNEINKSLPKELSRAEKIKLDFVEEMNNLNIEKGKESLKFSKELNELNLLEKEVKVKKSILEKESVVLKNKEKLGKITDEEKLRSIEIQQKMTELRKTQFKIIGKIIGYASLGIFAIMGLNYIRKLTCEKMPEGFCEWFKLKGDTENKKEKLVW